MAAKLTRLIHGITVQLHPVAESCTICSSCSGWPVQKLLDTPLYIDMEVRYSTFWYLFSHFGCLNPEASGLWYPLDWK